MDVPLIWREYFFAKSERQGDRRYGRVVDWWICRMCGQALMPNPAGANSHLAKHCRQVEAAKRAKEPA